MTGRILGWLLMADEPVQSLTAISTGLGVSKAGVSMAIRDLVRAEMVERVGTPGRRGNSYRLAVVDFETTFHLGEMERFSALMERALALVGPDHTALREAVEFLAFLRTEIPALMARWRIQYGQRAGADDNITNSASGSGKTPAKQHLPPLLRTPHPKRKTRRR